MADVSIKVALPELGPYVDVYDWGYLITLGSERPQIEAQPVRWRGDGLHLAGIGQTSLANLTRQPHVTLAFPPGAAPAPSVLVPPGGYTLIVDGTADVSERAKRTAIVVRPTSAVFHRPAPPPDD